MSGIPLVKLTPVSIIATLIPVPVNPSMHLVYLRHGKVPSAIASGVEEISEAASHTSAGIQGRTMAANYYLIS